MIHVILISNLKTLRMTDNIFVVVYVTHSDYASDQKSCHLQNRNKSEDHLVWDRPDEMYDCSYLKDFDTMMSSPQILWLADTQIRAALAETPTERNHLTVQCDVCLFCCCHKLAPSQDHIRTQRRSQCFLWQSINQPHTQIELIMPRSCFHPCSSFTYINSTF